jgi:hypothetical protein
VPLLLTGVLLLASPGSDSAGAYIHLIASVWWIVLLGAHLVRYFGRTLDAALRDRAAPEGSTRPAAPREAPVPQ